MDRLNGRGDIALESPLQRFGGLWLAIAGAGIAAASDYVLEAKRCLVPYAFDDRSPQYSKFWCMDLGKPLIIGGIMGAALLIVGLIWLAISLVRSWKLAKRGRCKEAT